MAVACEIKGKIAVVRVDNPPVNALDHSARRDLRQLVETLDKNEKLIAVVLCGSGATFIASTDAELTGEAVETPDLADLLEQVERAKKPWIAAVHGRAEGHGLDLALACRVRVAAEGAQLSFPEVGLGLIPAGGGTARLPRLVPLDAAVDMIADGRPIDAARALSVGLVDELAADDLEEAAIGLAVRAANLRPLRERPPQPSPSADFWTEQRRRIARKAWGQQAPLGALDCLEKAAEESFEAAIVRARRTYLELRSSDQAKALHHVFTAEITVADLAELEGVQPRSIETVGVVGGGTMGSGITVALQDAGLPVTLVERDEASLEKGLAHIRKIYDRSVARGRLDEDERQARMAALTPTTDYGQLGSADLVIEAVFEDLGVKRAVFQRLDTACSPHTILATNTSYLDPNKLAEVTRAPERVIGLHFFSPANVMKLIEIVRTDACRPDVLAAAFALAKRLGKIGVAAGVCDGFIGNRILKTYRTQAERVVIQGASPWDVDAAMREFGMPMGPFQVQDLAGLDIAHYQRKAARKRGEEPFAPIADRLVSLNRLGRKAGRGWYDFSSDDGRPAPSPEVERVIAAERIKAGTRPRSFSGEEIRERLLFPMIDTGARILDEGIATRPFEIDLVEIHGYGFPRWRGGLMYWGEATGLDQVVAKLEAFVEEGSLAPTSPFLKKAAARQSFSIA